MVYLLSRCPRASRAQERPGGSIACPTISAALRPLVQAQSLYERTAALVKRSEGGLGRDRLDQIVDIKPALRELRRLDLEHIHRMRGAPVGADDDMTEERIVDRRLF